MKVVLKIVLILIVVALVGDCCKYLYKIGTAPDPHRSSNPFSVSASNYRK